MLLKSLFGYETSLAALIKIGQEQRIFKVQKATFKVSKAPFYWRGIVGN